MKEKTIRVLKVEPRKAPVVVELKNELRALQEAVSIGASYVGLIEILELNEDACILCNEEGKLINLEPNRRFFDDVLCGVFYVTGQTHDGDLASLPEPLMQHYMEQYAIPEIISPSEVKKAMFRSFFVEVDD